MLDKVVILTGCASGLGLHLTQRFLDAGYRVVATDINLAGLEAQAQSRRWPTDQVRVHSLDVTSWAQWQEVWNDTLRTWKHVDILANVAGYLKPGRIHETAVEEIDRHLDINVNGLILGSKLAAEHMVPRGQGHIINIASLAGVAPIPGISLYSTSKFAVRGFTLALAQELKPLGVNATVICPDAIETPMLTLQEDYEEAALTFSGKHTLTVEQVADLILGKVLKDAPPEVLLPEWRGVLAKVGSAMPGLSFRLGNLLGKAGRSEQARRKAARQSKSGRH
ncbi:MAG: SDR family oxidoreductase [Hahellaceae bacterium]|nr:SDR family oxidoreductase [Hahellaceae bacterium]